MPVRFWVCLAAVLGLAGCSDNGTADAPETQAQAPEPAAEPATDADAQPDPPEDPEPGFVGRWAFDLDWCETPGEGAPMTISEDRFEGYENVCDITALSQTPEGSWAATLSCTGEGQPYTEDIVMAPLGDQLAITYLDRETDGSTLFHRCPTPDGEN